MCVPGFKKISLVLPDEYNLNILCLSVFCFVLVLFMVIHYKEYQGMFSIFECVC